MSTSPQTSLKEALRNLHTLPAMPVIAQKILVLNLESTEGETSMLKLIEKDPTIAAKIIGLANTPLFGASKRVASLTDAAMLLGLTRVKSVTLSIAVMSSLVKKPAGKLDVQGLWLHSLAIALAVRAIARAMPRHTRPLDDEIFLAGLLHDIGYMALNQLNQDLSDELHTRFAAETGRPSSEIEAELMDITHGELGGELARLWDLPDAIVAVLRYHHDPENPLADVGQPLVSMVNIAEKVLSSFGIGERSTPSISAEEWESLGIDPAKTAELIETISLQAEEAKQTAGNLL
ncbi:MAG: HDOD domain-containing protein [Gallionellaceae bacterium]